MIKKFIKIILLTLISQNIINSSNRDTSKDDETKCFSLKKPKIVEKDWNFLVYINSNNDLFPFSELNIKQMQQIGSNENINILVQQDVYGKAQSKRLYIEKGKKKTIERVTTKPESISGTPESLYSFMEWGIKNYPAKHQALILWDHGSGIIDPNIWKKFLKFNPLMLYKMNIETGFFELNREFLNKRGICFNEVFEVYLNNQKLKQVLEQVTTNLLNGKKINIIGMDACNMGMLEVASQIKNYADYMIASPEAEPGTGWNYKLVLQPLEKKSITPEEFSKNIVTAYQKHYEKNHQDFTQSAIRLNDINKLEENINEISKILIELIKGEKSKEIISQLKKLRKDRSKTTMFANPDYIDLHHFYTSISKLTNKMSQDKTNINIKDKLEKTANLTTKGTIIINDIVIEKTFCPSMPFTQGIAFYFPTKKIHNSYQLTDFAKSNGWLSFLEKYLS
ncbi:MAG: clostripain-related cysteine peptidase [bacterium]